MVVGTYLKSKIFRLDCAQVKEETNSAKERGLVCVMY